MNEQGLVVNLLALVELDYVPLEGTKVISLSACAQYILDNHATGAEAVAGVKQEEFQDLNETVVIGVVKGL